MKLSFTGLKRALPLLLGLAAFAVASRPAHAHHGVSLAASGDLVRVTIMPKSAAYTHDIWVKQPGTNWLFLGRSDQTGRATLIRVNRHRELQFAIRVWETNEVFYLGPHYRNPDNLVHAEVYQDGPAYLVGWEDLYGQSDTDFNDCMFRVEGAYLYAP